MVRLEVGAGICWCAGSGIAQQHVCLCVDLNMILRDNVAPPLGGERDGCSMLGVQIIVFKRSICLSWNPWFVREFMPGKCLGGNLVDF
jgi:hypothetical protein